MPRLTASFGESPMIKVAQSPTLMPRPQQICDMLNHWLGDSPERWPPQARIRVGDADISIVPIRMGLQGEIGVVVAGSERAGFSHAD
jgi:hypothetical protein